MREGVAALRDYYVYVLYRADGVTPFYVGKGRGRRVRDHSTPNHLNKKSRKASIARKTVKEIGFIPHRIVVAGVSNVRASHIERLLISGWGRVDLQAGILANMTNGGEGVSGAVVSEEVRKKQSESALRPEVVAAKSAATKRQYSTPESREQASERAIKALAPPEVRAKISAGVLRGLARPGVLEARTEAQRKACRDPENRAATSARAKVYANSEEGREARRRASNIRWAKVRSAQAETAAA